LSLQPFKKASTAINSALWMDRCPETWQLSSMLERESVEAF
jgi:hypothetical protein